MKILLIEDDTQLCMTIKEQLTKEGYIVDTCNAGDEAFLYAVDPDNDYDLAIIDRMLPIIDGLSIIKAMRQKNIQIPVIIITGMSELNDKIEGLDNGADDYLIKPYRIHFIRYMDCGNACDDDIGNQIFSSFTHNKEICAPPSELRGSQTV